MKEPAKELTQERLKELLHYDPDTGILKRICNNKIAGTVQNDGYIVVMINYNRYLVHRLAFLYMEGYIPENCVDHINRNTKDNSWCNLREVSHSCNMRNKKVAKNNKSGVTGVYWHKINKKWRANIKENRKHINIGTYENIIDAVTARWKAEVKYKFPNCNTTSSAYEYLKERNLI